MTKRLNRPRRIARILVQQTQVVPRIRNLRVLLQGIFQSRPSLINLLQIQQRNPLIQPRNRQLRIKLRRLPEQSQPLLKKLLIHVRRAEIIQPRRLSRICFKRTLRRSRE